MTFPGQRVFMKFCYWGVAIKNEKEFFIAAMFYIFDIYIYIYIWIKKHTKFIKITNVSLL